MLNALRIKIKEKVAYIDNNISRYFADRLGVKDIKTIEALGKDGQLTFDKKIDLFCRIMPLTKMEKSKFKVFTKINNDLVINNDILTYDRYCSDQYNYQSFLYNTYLNDDVLFSNKEKITFVIEKLIDDVMELTLEYIEKPKIYYSKDVGILLPQ
jgi:hypothetical protein